MDFHLDWLIMVGTALLCSSCSGELSFTDVPRAPRDSLATQVIFASGLRSVMQVGDRDTVSLSREHSSSWNDEPAGVRLRVITGDGHVRVDSLEEGFRVSAISDGMAVLRAGMGDHYRDFVVSVESSLPDDGRREYRPSGRIDIEGMEGGRTPAWVPFHLQVTLDGEPVEHGKGHIYMDGGSEDLAGKAGTVFPTGQHILLAEAEQDGVTLYRKFAVEAFQTDRLIFYAALVDGSSDRLGNAAVFMAGSVPGEESPVDLTVKISAGSHSEVLYGGSPVLIHGEEHLVATYWDVRYFVAAHPMSSFTLEIVASPLKEYHLLSVDCSSLVLMARQLTGKDLPVRINGESRPDGIYEPSMDDFQPR